MGKVRIGVIGAGLWATTSHLPVLARRPEDVEFVAVCRTGAAEVEAVAEQFGFAVATEDYREVLTAGVDACIVSSPAHLHYEHARAALDAGCHVLLEKPVTISSQDAWDLVERASAARLHLVVSFGWNYLPTYVTARELLDTHGIGEVTGLSVHMDSGIRELLLGSSTSSTGDPNDRADTATWTSKEISGGGYAQAALPHALGLALGLAGVRAKTVHGFVAGGGDTGIELYDAAFVACACRKLTHLVAIIAAAIVDPCLAESHELQVRGVAARDRVTRSIDRDHPTCIKFRGCRDRNAEAA